MILTDCMWCSKQVNPIEVHGHYQCPNCKINIDPCCSGETSDVSETALPSCNTQRYDE